MLIGSIELLSVVIDQLGLTGGTWGFASNVDVNADGYAVVGLFVITWMVALAVWRFAHIEGRWNANLQAR